MDILSFLKDSQASQAREREEDKELRVKERQEDMEYILAMIQKGVQKEVRAAIQPVEERLKAQEKVNEDLFKQLESAVKEIDMLRLKVQQESRAFPALQDLHNSGSAAENSPRQGFVRRSDQQDCTSSRTQELCASARRVIGFTPIEPRMLDLQIHSYGAKDVEEAKLMEIKSYLKCEMKMKPSEIEKLNIVRIFSPAKEDWKVLYVEFGSDFEVDMVISHTRNIVKPDHRVVRWYSRQMYDRYRAVESIAYDLRKRLHQKTRVKIGRDDIELYTKEPSSSFWRRHSLPDSLPDFDLDSRISGLSSPPPGRPGRDLASRGKDSTEEEFNTDSMVTKTC